MSKLCTPSQKSIIYGDRRFLKACPRTEQEIAVKQTPLSALGMVLSGQSGCSNTGRQGRLLYRRDDIFRSDSW